MGERVRKRKLIENKYQSIEWGAIVDLEDRESRMNDKNVTYKNWLDGKANKQASKRTIEQKQQQKRGEKKIYIYI